ncbi:nucleotidyltransferase family protein [Serratia ureilytica]
MVAAKTGGVMDPQRQIIDWLQQDDARMAALRTVRRLGLNDWCLGAGFVRNLVWDRRHGYVEPTPLNDIDVIHFDAERADAERDRMLEARLQQWLPQPWSVKNQARMHLRGGRAPYRNSEEAISFWTEVETAIGARLNADDSLTLVAPSARGAVRRHHHLQRENGDRAAYAQRVLDKGWLQRWPRLRQVKI